MNHDESVLQSGSVAAVGILELDNFRLDRITWINAAQLFERGSNLGHLGVREGRTRVGRLFPLRPKRKDDLLHQTPALMIGRMSETRTLVNIADGEDMGDVSSSESISRDPSPMIFHTGTLQSHLEIGLSSRGHKDVIDILQPGAVGEVKGPVLISLGSGLQRRARSVRRTSRGNVKPK